MMISALRQDMAAVAGCLPSPGGLAPQDPELLGAGQPRKGYASSHSCKQKEETIFVATATASQCTPLKQSLAGAQILHILSFHAHAADLDQWERNARFDRPPDSARTCSIAFSGLACTCGRLRRGVQH